MSLEAALKAFIAEVVREVSANSPAAPAAAKRGPGRPPKGEDASPPAAGAQPTAAVAAAATASAAVTTALPATPAAPAALTHAAVAPSFLAAAKAHGRDFVIAVMKELGVPGDPPTFDKVPIASLPAAKALLEAGPKAKPAATDGTDLLG